MKKILLLFLMCLLLTGCTTEVVLKIDEEKVSETIKISDLKINTYQNDAIKEDISINLEDFEREFEFYDTNEFEADDYVGKTYELTEDIELWAELSHVRPCYESFDLEKTDTKVSLSTSDEYLCGYLFSANNVTLIIESDLELISSNADEVQNGKIIWNINDTNYQNKPINFEYKIPSAKEKEIKEQRQYMIYILIFIVVVGSIIGIYIYKRKKECNKF